MGGSRVHGGSRSHNGSCPGGQRAAGRRLRRREDDLQPVPGRRAAARLLSAHLGICLLSHHVPIDTAKTRMQNQKPVDGVMPYTSLAQTIRKIAKAEGPLSLMNGF